jgi:hypothetical protein
MKMILSAVALWLTTIAVWAQAGGVSVDVSLDQDQFLASEEIRAAVRINNLSGQTLNLGKTENWLTFSIEATDNFIVQRLGNAPVAGDFSVDSSMMATKRVNLTPYFNLQKPGRYRVTARVKVAEWNQEIVSAPRTFTIISGAKLQVIQFGVPSATGEKNATPEVRKYILQQAEYLKEMKLYLRVTDANEIKVFKVFPLGRMISFGQPDARVDRFNNLHVLHQIGQRSFNYCVVNPDGQMISRQTHDFLADSRPRLLVQEDGRVVLHGGVRHVTESDLPPAEAVSLTETTPKSDPDAKPSKP